MKRMILIAMLLMTAGCATKNYGRQGSLTKFEQDTLTCREIDLEIARAQGFLDQVKTESKFSGKDVLAILGDFGIGNRMERKAAIRSANKRTAQLRDLRAASHCDVLAGTL